MCPVEAADELERYLNALAEEDSYRVDAVLKESPAEVTQRVFRASQDGSEQGPFIRKLIKRGSGLGTVYEQLYECQIGDMRFEYLPRFIECYAREDELVVVMEHIDGITLEDFVSRVGPSAELAKAVFPRVCDAVQELHESLDQPIIHRDLKPSNIIVRDYGNSDTIGNAHAGYRIALIDFGIARQYKDDAESDTTHFGTRAFAPPEQYGFGQTSVKSDMYALGMVLYFCLTGKIPTSRQREDGFPDLQKYGALRKLVVQATRFDPDERFTSVRALRAAFDASVALGDAPVASSETRNAPEAAPAPQAAPASHAVSVPPAAQAGSALRNENGKAPEIVGRIWNVFVVVCFCALIGYMVFSMFSGRMVTQAGEPYETWQIALVFVIDTVLFAAVAFACLDKRRLRAKLGPLKNVRAWQCWVVVLICYAIAAGSNMFLK